jgi:hypothetical protein
LGGLYNGFVYKAFHSLSTSSIIFFIKETLTK